MNAISIQGLTKKFDNKIALDEFTLDIEANQVYGLLGPNGAGKSTLINILSTFLYPDKGSAKIMDFDVVKQAGKVREIVDISYGGTHFQYNFNAKEILTYYAMLYGINGYERQKRVSGVIELFDITEFESEKFSNLSTGMKQKINLAKSFLSEPEVLFLDEPSLGLDVKVSREIRETILTIVKESEMTVLLASHIMSEVEELCDNLCYLQKGKLLFNGGIRELRKRFKFPSKLEIVTDKQVEKEFLDYNWIKKLKIDENVISFSSFEPLRIQELLKNFKNNKIEIIDFTVQNASLEDMYLELQKEESK